MYLWCNAGRLLWSGTDSSKVIFMFERCKIYCFGVCIVGKLHFIVVKSLFILHGCIAELLFWQQLQERSYLSIQSRCMCLLQELYSLLWLLTILKYVILYIDTCFLVLDNIDAVGVVFRFLIAINVCQQ